MQIILKLMMIIRAGKQLHAGEKNKIASLPTNKTMYITPRLSAAAASKADKTSEYEISRKRVCLGTRRKASTDDDGVVKKEDSTAMAIIVIVVLLYPDL